MPRLKRRPRQQLAEILPVGKLPVARPQNNLWGGHRDARNYDHRGDRGKPIRLLRTMASCSQARRQSDNIVACFLGDYRLGRSGQPVNIQHRLTGAMHRRKTFICLAK